MESQNNEDVMLNVPERKIRAVLGLYNDPDKEVLEIIQGLREWIEEIARREIEAMHEICKMSDGG